MQGLDVTAQTVMGTRCSNGTLRNRLKGATRDGHANGKGNESGLYSCLAGASRWRVMYMYARREAVF